MSIKMRLFNWLISRIGYRDDLAQIGKTLKRAEEIGSAEQPVRREIREACQRRPVEDYKTARCGGHIIVLKESDPVPDGYTLDR